MRSLIVLVAGIIAAPVAAQAPSTIDPGMTRAQVVAKLGEPLSTRTYDGHTYLLYKNGCEKKCGMNDLVVLDSGKVIDAVFRSRARHYSGTSSSPRMISAADAKHGAGAPMKVPESPAKKPDAPPGPSA
ncbi:MAG TPA: outer membrane protein assembly factor BamE [Gemmatimonadaceae bacterium]|jgi:SmpA / OmlA family|nr:outer membrane protein assembly factor BamE [Gemmatimonadaceae bacterium]